MLKTGEEKSFSDNKLLQDRKNLEGRMVLWINSRSGITWAERMNVMPFFKSGDISVESLSTMTVSRIRFNGDILFVIHRSTGRSSFGDAVAHA